MTPDQKVSSHSFQASQEYYATTMRNFSNRERHLANISLNDLVSLYKAEPPSVDFSDFYTQLLGINSGLDTEMSAAEYATLCLIYPALGIESPSANSLWRYIRTLEMGLKRQLARDQVLAIGAGQVIPDYLGVFLQPPTHDDLLSAIKVTESNSSNNPLKSRTISYYEGRLFAIEPDEIYLSKQAELTNTFSVDANRITRIPSRIQDVLQTDVLPTDIDLVLWHRADPIDFTFINKKGIREVSKRDVSATIRELHKHISPGGAVIYTIGPGNGDFDKNETVMRQEFLKIAITETGNLGYKRINLPQRMNTNPYQSTVGDLGFGIFEAATFIKQ